VEKGKGGRGGGGGGVGGGGGGGGGGGVLYKVFYREASPQGPTPFPLGIPF